MPSANPTRIRESTVSSSMPPSPAKSIMSRRGDYSDSIDMSSEIGSEVGYEGDELKVGDHVLRPLSS
jgi:hypothetical protein